MTTRPSKWIADVAAEAPLSQAARVALTSRLEAVGQCLAEAATNAGGDQEGVHQLRVWSRRADAAMRIFRDVLPPRRGRWMRKRLKRIRRAAGEARDLDVMAARMAARPDDKDPTASSALALIEARRREAQDPIAAVRQRLAEKGFDRRAAALVERIRYRGEGVEPSFGRAARDGLRRTVGDFFKAANGDLSDVAALHEFRIAGKRLRYSLEIYADVLPPVVRDAIYPLVEELQENLGRVNDHAAAIVRLRAWRDEADDDEDRSRLERLLSAERSGLVRSRRAFLAWWTPDREAGVRRQFAAALAAPATRAG
jgi:CHAD domain-containing protein